MHWKRVEFSFKVHVKGKNCKAQPKQISISEQIVLTLKKENNNVDFIRSGMGLGKRFE